MRFFQQKNSTAVQMGGVNAPVAEQDPASQKENDVEMPAVLVNSEQVVDEQGTGAAISASGSESDDISKDAQSGVQKMEAATKTWSRWHVFAAYALIWFIYFVDSLQQGMAGALMPYVTSSFQEHSLTAATSVMSSIIGGLCKLPLAKILDIWGRPQGFALSMFTLVIGLIIMAACQSVQTFAAAQVFYWVGFNGMSYSLQIFIADTSALKNRALMFAFINSPYLATTWIGGPLATAFLKGPGFRWGFGTFVIVTPIVSLPLLLLFIYNTNKARKAGLLEETKVQRTFAQSLRHYAIEFDVVGLLLIIGGLALFLLPFSIYSYQPLKWRSPMILSFLVIGVVLIFAFAFYEKYLAPKTFIPFDLLVDRTVMGGCLTSGALFISFYIWDNFFTSFLQVVNGLTVTQSSYIAAIFSIGSCFFSVIVGFLVRWTGRFKWLALYFGVPMTIIGVGLMIHFRQPDGHIGYVVMCQIFIAFAGGALVICEQMAVMASVPHQYLAVALALENMFANIGGGIGASIASAVWTGIFPKRLAAYLPAESLGNLTQIYGDLTVQLSYPKGSATRKAIEMAYGDAQRDMLIAATAILTIPLISVATWRDIKVTDMKQTKGRVVIHTRLLADRPLHTITTINSPITQPGDWALNATGYLHWDSLGHGNFSVNTYDIGAANRCYIIDEDPGRRVDIFEGFPGLDRTVLTMSALDSHLFRFEGGRIRYVHTVSHCIHASYGMNGPLFG